MYVTAQYFLDKKTVLLITDEQTIELNLSIQPDAIMDSYILIGFTAFLGTLFAGGAMLLAKLVSYRSPDSLHKKQAYECSETPIGDARIRFKVSYYIFALLFLLFDIESLFLFPCMKIFRAVVSGTAGAVTINLLYIELFGFIFVLFSGLIYAWRKGVLVWE